MRIIRLGPDPASEKHHTCRNCGTEFAYMPIDVKARDYKDYTGSSDTAYELTCPAPHCGKVIQCSRL